MGNFTRLIFAISLCFLPQLALADKEFSIYDYVVEPKEEIYGKPLHNYVNDWWEWAYSMQQASSPIHDMDGTFCGVNQSGPIWFLAGGFGSAQLHRQCTIPANKHIFFPVINALTFTPPGEEMSCAVAKHTVAVASIGFKHMQVFVNGRNVEYVARFKMGSKECFNLFERVPAKFNAPSVAPSATDGYWIMLRPLPVGANTLQFMGYHADSSGAYAEMLQSIYYDLDILAE
ncbi:hypothetical protein [Maritalea sp.]|uniref:hypothetical protein n=1 Tax=Maritalea sp. TaxID=2003361 RepID=UPI003EF92150